MRLDSTGLSIQGPWGSFVPIGALADGYAATLGWLSDILGWASLFKKKSFAPDFPGIVLLDEIEQHLHPNWQRRIIKLLRDQFPRLQFIGTTHAPMCAIGTTDLSDRECELVVLSQTGEHVEAIGDQKQGDLRSWAGRSEERISGWNCQSARYARVGNIPLPFGAP